MGTIKLMFAPNPGQNSFAIEVENYSMENYSSLELCGSVSSLRLIGW